MSKEQIDELMKAVSILDRFHSTYKITDGVSLLAEDHLCAALYNLDEAMQLMNHSDAII